MRKIPVAMATQHADSASKRITVRGRSRKLYYRSGEMDITAMNISSITWVS